MSSGQKTNEYVIFNTARKIDSIEARKEYLTQVCAGDAALMERVENLLQSQADESQFLEAPALAPTQSLAKIREQPGEQIGRYKLLQQIGEGGFGVVYMAEQEKPVRRKVALKVIKAGMDTKEVVARFEAERQALALMEHPNIAKVLDGGSTDSGRPYFVMELVKGVPMTQFCDENKLDTSKRLQLFHSVCKAIQHAHHKGIIHRDIKPSNVMVTLHDGEPIVKVIDFGVAKAISQQLTDKTMFTAYGQMIGTPQYMSPEQAEMSGLDIDTRSDVYSLGVLLYELLAGSTPIEPERLRETAYAEMQRMIREEEPPRPSVRLSTQGEQSARIATARNSEAKKLGDLLRGELDWIVMKALEKNRDRRYETANGLANDVQRYLQGEAVTACPPSLRYRFKKFASKHRGILVSTGSVLLVLLVATVLSTLFGIRANNAERIANQNLDDLRVEQKKNIEANNRLVAARGQESLDNAFDQFFRGNLDESLASLEIARTHGTSPGEIALCEAAINHYSEDLSNREHAEEALRLLPDSMAAKILLSNAYKYDAAVPRDVVLNLLAQIKAMEPESPIDLLIDAQFYANAKDHGLCIEYLEKLLTTHNSRSVYYELSRVYNAKARNTYDLDDIEKSVQYSEIAYRTMPNNDLAARRYINAQLVEADYHRLHENSALEKDHLRKAELAAYDFVKSHDTSAYAYQTLVSVLVYKGEWSLATEHSLLAAKYMRNRDEYACAPVILFREGRDPYPVFEQISKYFREGEAWLPLITIYSKGPEAGFEAFSEWESQAKLSKYPGSGLAAFETLCLLGKPEEAVRIAGKHLKEVSPLPRMPFSAWLNKFVSGQISEAELFAAAETRLQRIPSYFYTGCLRMAEGRRDEAIHAFEQMEKEGKAAWGISNMFYTRGEAYLHRMRTDPEWPPWIPNADSE